MLSASLQSVRAMCSRSLSTGSLPPLRLLAGDEVAASSVLSGTKVLVGVVGAFTGVCTEKHIPGFADESVLSSLSAKGVDGVVVVSVNDHLVLSAWADAMGLKDHDSIEFVSDYDAAFTDALGQAIDLSAAGLGVRSHRYAVVVKDGEFGDFMVEEAPGQLKVSDAASVVSSL